MSLSVMQSLESFNSQRDGILLMDGDKVAALKEGFNSQRDGILLPHMTQRLLNFHVSIPNGMEFYGALPRV